jgi:hypothetical protein
VDFGLSDGVPPCSKHAPGVIPRPDRPSGDRIAVVQRYSACNLPCTHARKSSLHPPPQPDHHQQILRVVLLAGLDPMAGPIPTDRSSLAYGHARASSAGQDRERTSFPFMRVHFRLTFVMFSFFLTLRHPSK